MKKKASHRSRKVEKLYAAHKAKLIKGHDSSPPCPLCSLGKREVLETGEYFTVVANSFPYNQFDLQAVDEHYMIVPIRHVGQLKDLKVEEKVEHLRLLAKYMDQGYSAYIRSIHDRTSTIPAHLHIHLLKYKK